MRELDWGGGGLPFLEGNRVVGWGVGVSVSVWCMVVLLVIVALWLIASCLSGKSRFETRRGRGITFLQEGV